MYEVYMNYTVVCPILCTRYLHVHILYPTLVHICMCKSSQVGHSLIFVYKAILFPFRAGTEWTKMSTAIIKDNRIMGVHSAVLHLLQYINLDINRLNSHILMHNSTITAVW